MTKFMRFSGVLSELKRRTRHVDHEADLKLARERRSFKRAIRPRRVVSGHAARLLNGQMARGGRPRTR